MSTEDSDDLNESLDGYVIEWECSARELAEFWGECLMEEPPSCFERFCVDDIDFDAISSDTSEWYLDLPNDSSYSRGRSPPPWRIGFTQQFRKDILQLDRKLQGRILETLQSLSDLQYPFRIMGDTFKPLKGNLKGFWRYRLGDFRLVINPVVAESEIDVITFSARGDVYD